MVAFSHYRNGCDDFNGGMLIGNGRWGRHAGDRVRLRKVTLRQPAGIDREGGDRQMALNRRQ
jgi:hypothetical protein